MDVEKIKSTVKKLTRLLDQINEEASPIEKDLVLDYLRVAYDQVLQSDSPQVKSNFESQPSSSLPTETEISNTPLHPSPPKPVIETNLHLSALKIDAVPQEIPHERHPTIDSSALLNLFQPLTAHDLSEKLGAQPIRNVKQAFSINDRLLFINELFGKNADLFADTLKMVDNYESWEPAKSVLLNLASQFHWEKGEKSEIARQFIKTIQRKFT